MFFYWFIILFYIFYREIGVENMYKVFELLKKYGELEVLKDISVDI